MRVDGEWRYIADRDFWRWYDALDWRGQHVGYLPRVSSVRAPGPARVVIEAQGSLFKVRRMGSAPRSGNAGGGRRGRVHGLSRASRRRLLETCARLDAKQVAGHRHYAVMLTLTYGGPEGALPTIEQTKAHKRAFVERLRRRFPQCSGILRLEFESSGVRDYHPHWHFLLFNLPYVPAEVINRWWSEIVGSRWSSEYSTRIEKVRSLRGVLHYAAKYVGKAGGGLVNAAYPHAPSLVVSADGNGVVVVGPDDPVHTGRLWSVFNRSAMPWADLVTFAVARGGRGGWFYDLKRMARRVWPGVNGLPWAGFTLFVDNPERWAELALGSEYSRYRAAGGVSCIGSR